MVALLVFLERIGDAGALPAVYALAVATVTTSEETRVQNAAGKCLPILWQQAQKQEAVTTLLRASSAEDTTGASLLRTARDSNTDAPEQLLRASRSDDEPSG